MRTNYPKVSIFNFRKAFKKKEEYGYYTGIKYIPEIDILFRTYAKGKNEETDGLQIYQGTMLIGDVDIPKGVKIIGYSNGYTYGFADVRGDEEELCLYRIKF